MTSLMERSRTTVEELLAKRPLARTYEERCRYAMDLVDTHLHEENPERIDECIRLYTPDAIWECPARGVSYTGRQKIKEMIASGRSLEEIRKTAPTEEPPAGPFGSPGFTEVVYNEFAKHPN